MNPIGACLIVIGFAGLAVIVIDRILQIVLDPTGPFWFRAALVLITLVIIGLVMDGFSDCPD